MIKVALRHQEELAKAFKRVKSLKIRERGVLGSARLASFCSTHMDESEMGSVIV